MCFQIEIVSVPDRDGLVAEIWWQDEMLAEIHHGEASKIEIYPRHLTDKNWEFDLDELMQIIEKAQSELALSRKVNNF